MAYNDYGAFVWKNGERMESNEDAVLSRLDGGDGGTAIYCYLMDAYPSLRQPADGGHEVVRSAGGDGATAGASLDSPKANDLYHAVLGDGDWRLGVYKCSTPWLLHRVDGVWKLVDLLSYAGDGVICVDPGDDCECEKLHVIPASYQGARVYAPIDYYWWAKLPDRRLEINVPDGPVVIFEPGRDHARWHELTVHVTMIDGGDHWEAEVGCGYGAGFEGNTGNRARNARAIVEYCERTGGKRWRRMSVCPQCKRKPIVSVSRLDYRAKAECPSCGLAVRIHVLGGIDLDMWEPDKHDLGEMKLTAWARGNVRQLLAAEWNALANDAKRVSGARTIGEAGRTDYCVTFDGKRAVDVSVALPARDR